MRLFLFKILIRLALLVYKHGPNHVSVGPEDYEQKVHPLITYCGRICESNGWEFKGIVALGSGRAVSAYFGDHRFMNSSMRDVYDKPDKSASYRKAEDIVNQ